MSYKLLPSVNMRIKSGAFLLFPLSLNTRYLAILKAS